MTVDIYASSKLDASGFFEGEQYLGTAVAQGAGRYDLPVTGRIEERYLSATATDDQDSTSEFSLRTPLIFVPGAAGESAQ